MKTTFLGELLTLNFWLRELRSFLIGSALGTVAGFSASSKDDWPMWAAPLIGIATGLAGVVIAHLFLKRPETMTTLRIEDPTIAHGVKHRRRDDLTGPITPSGSVSSGTVAYSEAEASIPGARPWHVVQVGITNQAATSTAAVETFGKIEYSDPLTKRLIEVTAGRWAEGPFAELGMPVFQLKYTDIPAGDTRVLDIGFRFDDDGRWYAIKSDSNLADWQALDLKVAHSLFRVTVTVRAKNAPPISRVFWIENENDRLTVWEENRGKRYAFVTFATSSSLLNVAYPGGTSELK